MPLEIVDACPVCRHGRVLSDESGNNWRPCWACQGEQRVFQIYPGKRTPSDGGGIIIGMTIGIFIIVGMVKTCNWIWDQLENLL